MDSSRLLAGMIVVFAALPAAGAGNGLVPPADTLETTHWQARFEVDNPASLGRPLATNWALDQSPLTGRLVGDYRMDTLRFGQTGGLRLTSGVLVNLRNPATNGLGMTPSVDNPSAAQPYAGIGYSGAGSRGDWGFSAELGLAAQNPGAAVQFGRLFNGVSFGDTVRDLRLQPMIRLGMNYAF
jgi:hypothetical protein